MWLRVFRKRIVCTFGNVKLPRYDTINFLKKNYRIWFFGFKHFERIKTKFIVTNFLQKKSSNLFFFLVFVMCSKGKNKDFEGFKKKNYCYKFPPPQKKNHRIWFFCFKNVFQSSLTFSKHIGIIANKATRIVGVIRRNFDHMDEQMFKTLYKSMVRPHLEYANTIWSPFLKVIRHQLHVENKYWNGRTWRNYLFVGHLKNLL